MKRLLPVITLLSLILMASTVSAQYQEDAVLLTIDAGGTMAKSAYSGDMLSGTAAGFTIDKVLSEGKFTVGGTIAWLRSEETVEIDEGMNGNVTYSSTPFRLTGRWNFLNSKFAANVGLGLGIHTSTRKLYEGTIDEISTTTSGLDVGLPITLAYFLDPGFYLTAIYSPTYMSGSFADDDFAHGFMFGLGFQWGVEEN